MLKELNKATPYVATIKTKTVKCLALQNISSGSSIAAKISTPVNKSVNSPDSGKKVTTTDLLRNLNSSNRVTPLPVIDQTGTEQYFDIDFTIFSDLNALNKALAKYNLSLMETECGLPMMVIEDKEQNINQVNPPTKLN
ncbi:hypothetical protein SDC9_152808 [bioreactor metagenome]